MLGGSILHRRRLRSEARRADGLAVVIGPDTDAGQVPYDPLASADIDASTGVWDTRETGTRDERR